jgi:exodeoxyribonuclease V alpha subunit
MAACLWQAACREAILETLTGVLSDITYHKNGFLIGRLSTGDTILGDMLEPCLWQEYRFRGDWSEHPRWGRQFKFVHHQAEIPQTTDGIYRYIVKTAKWVGPEIGKQIIVAFGEKTLEVLKHDPQRVAICIKGITLERAEEISANLLGNEDIETAQVELEHILGGHHLSKKTISCLIQKYKSDAPAKVRQDPYLLQEIRGVGFPSADRVALAIGIDRGSEARRRAATIHVLKEAAETRGHVWLPLEKYEEKLQALIGIPSDGIAGQTPDVILEKHMVALSDLAGDEKDVAGIIRMLRDSSLLEPDSDNLEGLADDQREALEQALKEKVFILTGAPGTGKTFTLQRMIQEFEDRELVIRLAAPTGKAAKRMSEVTGREASTIHRLLEPEPYQTSEGLRFAFSRGIGNPIQADVVVVDEFSMVDVSLAASLLRALDAGTRLLIVGDHYQLPSVGPGSVLRDLLAAGVPSFELTRIKRNTGDIVQACHAIKDGRPISPSLTLEPENGLNLRHIEEQDPLLIQEIIRDLVVNRLPQRGYDPVWDIQVLSPMNEKTLLSCLHLNEIMQEALNPMGREIKGTAFRIGDKVIQRKNESIGEVFVVNGDLGTLRFYDDQERRSKQPTHKLTVDFQDPDREALIPVKEHHLSLAYCLTIHKMQGSEAPVVIIPVHNSFGVFFNRELIYTAISRAREICITVGQWGALEQAATRIGNDRRITRLTELLRGCR